jgi:hypothetical protein
MENRFDLVKNIVKNIKNGIFVEIGTHKGDLADFILENSENSVLYCIDPYKCYNEYDDAINTYTGDELYLSTYNRLNKKYGNRVIIIRKFSEDSINDIPNEIDFLYIDGNHSYKYVLNDLKLYYPKVKKNGFIIGDDAVDNNDLCRNENGDIFIEWCPGSYGHYGVIKAFREFCLENSLQSTIEFYQYIIEKPT